MKSSTKHPLFLVTFGVVLYTVLMNAKSFLQVFQNIIGLILPIILGLVFAFVLNVPMRGFEKMLARFLKSQKKINEKSVHKISLLLTLFSIVLVIAVAGTIIVPALANSVNSIYPLIKEKLPEWIKLWNQYSSNVKLEELFNITDIQMFLKNTNNILGTAVQAATSTVSGITSILFGFIISVYVLLSKQTLTSMVKKLLYANMKKASAEKLFYMGQLARDTYARFLSGQCMEAIILGCLIFIAFSVFRLPYAGLIGILTGIFAFVPYIGAFASCAIGAFLIALVSPSKVLICVVVYMIVQFIENQFIYPHVVGSSVGLAPLWTLLAALIGGKLFGVIGIVFFIPLTAFLYALIREDTYHKLEQKGIGVVSEEQEPGNEL